jgi:hypothetical protein
MEAPYTLDSAIQSFFEEANTTATRQQCNDFALVHGGGESTVKPVKIQGMFSYTILVGDTIFQFRVPSSRIDTEFLNLAAAIHGKFISGCTYHGTIGEPQPLDIYEMKNLPGIPYIMAQHISITQPPTAAIRQEKTVQDFAKYSSTPIAL